MEMPTDGTAAEAKLKRIALESDRLRIEILPDCGGKIVTLTSVGSGRQWLWQNPFLAHRIPAYGASYIAELDSGGWDDIFPTIDPCILALADGSTMSAPDHGDLVCMGSETESLDDATVITRWRGRCASFLFTRTVRLDPVGLEVGYRLENIGPVAFPWLACPHPLMALEPGMRLELPRGTPFEVQAVEGEPPMAVGDRFEWPGDPDLSVIPDPAAMGAKPFALKLFSEPGSVSKVGWRSPDGLEVIELQWNPDDLPYLGFWMNQGGWSGSGSPNYHNLGIEPATAPCDDLGEAVEKGWARTVEPGETREWTVKVGLDAG